VDFPVNDSMFSLGEINGLALQTQKDPENKKIGGCLAVERTGDALQIGVRNTRNNLIKT
jgi:hypothetical protein